MSVFGLPILMLSLVGLGVGVVAWKIAAAALGREQQSLDTSGARARTGVLVLFLLLPASIGIATLVEWGAALLLQAQVEAVHFGVFWSDIAYASSVSVPEYTQMLLASSGPATLLVMAGLLTWLTVRYPGRSPDALLRLEWARMILWTVLVIYPVGSLATKSGQFHELSRLSALSLAHGGAAFVGAYGIAAAMLITIWRGPWQQDYRWLTSPLRDRYQDIQKRLLEEPDWLPGLRDLGRIYMQRAEPRKALSVLARAHQIESDCMESLYLLGMANLQTDQLHKASKHLRVVGLNLEERRAQGDRSKDQLLFDTTLGLAAARLRLRDIPGALLTAREATRHRPTDPRAALIMADALLAAGRLFEAESILERALENPEGGLHGEILSRLALLQS